MRVLVISNVWVEPNSSAAGERMLQILSLFLTKGYTITYASTASESEFAYDLESIGIDTVTVAINDDTFDDFAKALSPQIVLYDRFMAEEQFGWRISESCPKAIQILDTEDLHCLRKARHQALKEKRAFVVDDLMSDVAKREIASIYRSDLTLIISSYEMELLTDFFKVPATLLYYLPFLVDTIDSNFMPYGDRKHFVSIGNFLHPPNWDAVRILKEEIWPIIRKDLPEVQLHVYGAYPSNKVLQLHSENEGFIIKGRADIASEVIKNTRVLLAPLRFGAGLKGKFIDAMRYGTPSVTTAIGSEAMHGILPWAGYVADDFFAFAKAAIHLYQDEKKWHIAQKNGQSIIRTHFQKEDLAQPFLIAVEDRFKNLEQHRLSNFTGQLLQHHTMQSTKFMSRWIALKNK